MDSKLQSHSKAPNVTKGVFKWHCIQLKMEKCYVFGPFIYVTVAFWGPGNATFENGFKMQVFVNDAFIVSV